jgi:hypothetical protein
MAEGLIFLMRVRQAEETIDKRRDDLLKRQKTAASLEVELEHEKCLAVRILLLLAAYSALSIIGKHQQHPSRI